MLFEPETKWRPVAGPEGLSMVFVGGTPEASIRPIRYRSER